MRGQGISERDPEKSVNLRQGCGQLLGIALDETACHDKPCAIFFVLGQVEDGVDRLLFGWRDKATGVDDEQIGRGRVVRLDPARCQKGAPGIGRVDDIFCAAQGGEKKTLHGADYRNCSYSR